MAPGEQPHAVRPSPSRRRRPVRREGATAVRAGGQRRRGGLGGVVALFVALLLVAGLVWAVRFSSLLDTRAVVVTGGPPDVVADVRRAVGEPDRRPLAAADLEAIGRRATQVPTVEEASVSRTWPHTLTVRVTPRVPVLAVAQEGGVRLLDRSGVAYATAPSAPDGVPVVSAGDAADGRALAGAVSMMAALPADLRGRVSGVTVKSADTMTFAVDDTTVRWGDASQPELKVKIIQALLDEKVQVIDVSAPSAPATS